MAKKKRRRKSAVSKSTKSAVSKAIRDHVKSVVEDAIREARIDLEKRDCAIRDIVIKYLKNFGLARDEIMESARRFEGMDKKIQKEFIEPLHDLQRQVNIWTGLMQELLKELKGGSEQC